MAVKGVGSVIAELRSKSKNLDRIIDVETKNAAFKIEQDAINLAPKDNGYLHQQIRSEKVGELTYKIGVNAFYGAYVEFGTGLKVRVPEEFKDIANSFRGQKNGTFEKGLEAITEWMRKKGMDTKNAKWFFLKILGTGINPQPFLYPAWVKGQREYLKALTNLLKKYK